MRTIVVVLLLTACGGGGASEPISGTWTYLSTATNTDNCDIVPLLGLDAGSFELVNDGDGTLTIDDGEWVFECTLTGSDFDCPDRFPGGFATSGVDFEVVGEAHGTFDGDSAATGGQTGTASCADSSCEMAAAMVGITPPCDVDVAFGITFGG